MKDFSLDRPVNRRCPVPSAQREKGDEASDRICIGRHFFVLFLIFLDQPVRFKIKM